jgi:hypothetical protein
MFLAALQHDFFSGNAVAFGPRQLFLAARI